MTLIQIGISTQPAAEVVDQLVKLLELRYTRRIQRKVFLVKWASLRRVLAMTAEYQDFRRAIFARDRQCVKCGSVIGLIVHHKRPVSREPRRALQLSNGEARCRDCHTHAHPWMRGAA